MRLDLLGLTFCGKTHGDRLQWLMTYSIQSDTDGLHILIHLNAKTWVIEQDRSFVLLTLKELLVSPSNSSTFACTVYSLCTTLLLEWEPDLIAISVLYLSCRLMKFKVTSWVDKPNDYTGKWYIFFVNDVNLDIIESKFLCFKPCGCGTVISRFTCYKNKFYCCALCCLSIQLWLLHIALSFSSTVSNL